MPVNDILELRPVVEKYVREMYGGKLSELRISDAKKLDFAALWYVEVEAEDAAKSYLFEVKIDDNTGKVTSFEKRWEKPLRPRYSP
jgi:hypothetical protein